MRRIEEMSQLDIYSYLGVGTDPVYVAICKLKEGEKTTISNFEVKYNNFGLYEVSNEHFHEVFASSEACYEGLIYLFQEAGEIST